MTSTLQAISSGRRMRDKECTTCHKTKRLEMFNKDKSRPDSHSNRCRTCALAKWHRLRAGRGHRDGQSGQTPLHGRSVSDRIAE